MPYLRFHQPGQHCLNHLRDSQRLSPTQFTGPPKLLSPMNGWSWLRLHTFLNPLKQATAGLSKSLGLVPVLLSGPSPGLAAASLHSPFSFAWESPGPAQVAAICRLLCSLYRVATGGTQVGADLGLHHLGNPRACAPSRQLQTMLKHRHPAPA